MNNKYFCNNIDGILLLDKPIKVTSNAALQTIRKLLRATKAGHSGSLDPLASGMLAICLGEATKFSSFMLEAPKVYEVVAQLGQKTTTGDSEGDIVETKVVPKLSFEAIQAALNSFKGEIEQIPPMYSALKHNGEPLYKLARAGIEVARQPRLIKIHDIELLEYPFNGDSSKFKFRVHSSKGTYIRTLVEDIAIKAGTIAHVSYLRRTSLGNFKPEQMVTMNELLALTGSASVSVDIERYLSPVDSALTSWPEINLSSGCVSYICNGVPIKVPNSPEAGLVKINNDFGKFLGIGEILSDGRMTARKLLSQARVTINQQVLN